jgi:hypothetical protein
MGIPGNNRLPSEVSIIANSSFSKKYKDRADSINNTRTNISLAQRNDLYTG